MKKKILAVALCMGIMVPGQLPTMAASETETEVYKTDFDGFSGGAAIYENWSFNGDALPWFTGSTFAEDSASSVQAVTDAENGTALQLVSTPEDNTAGIYSGAKYTPDMPLTSGIYKLSFKAKTDENSAARMLIRVRDEDNTVSDDLFMLGSDGCVKDVANNNANVGIGINGLAMKLNTGSWHAVEMVIDMETDDVMCFVDSHGAYRTSLSGLSDISELLFAANNANISIDDVEISQISGNENYVEASQDGYVYNTNFSEFIDYRSNGANPGALNFKNWNLQNASWRGHVYGAKTDRGVSLKIADTAEVTNYSKLINGYCGLPETLSDGTYTIAFYLKAGEAMSVFKLQLSGEDGKTTDVLQINGDGCMGLPSGSELKCTPNEWNKIELVADLSSDTVTAFVNKICIGSSTYSGDISRVWYNVEPKSFNGDIYVDDLSVYKDDAEYGPADTTGYIFNENFSEFVDYESNGTPEAQTFGQWQMGNAAWRGGVYGVKTDKGISMKMADALNIVSPNQYNDAEYMLESPITSGKYTITLEEMYHGSVTAPLKIELKGTKAETGTSAEFVFDGNGYMLGVVTDAPLLAAEQWNTIEIKLDMDARTAEIYVNGMPAKTVEDLVIEDLSSILLNTRTTENAPDSRGDVYIDNFTMKQDGSEPDPEQAKLDIEVSDTGAVLTFDSAAQTAFAAIASYDAEGRLISINTQTVAEGEITIEKPEGADHYKAFLWSAADGEGAMTPIIRSVSAGA